MRTMTGPCMGLGVLVLIGACAGQNDDTEMSSAGSGIYSVSAATLPADAPTSTPAETTAGESTTSGSTTDGATEGTTEVGGATSSTVPDPPASTSGGSSSTGDNVCVGVRVVAEQKVAPVDILLVVDNSGSMAAENGEVQANLQEFADALAASALDFRLILLSQYPVAQQIGICVDAPLGNGECPSSDSKHPFLHIDHFVDSHSALSDILATSDLWHTTMRTDSHKHLMVVSDDEAAMQKDTPQANADAFHAALLATFPEFAGRYAFHAITGIPGVSKSCGIADYGDTYVELTQSQAGERSPGVLADLCEQDFDPVFAAISQSIADGAELPCVLELPDPEEGQLLDPDEVNVHLHVNGMTVNLVQVKNGFDCGSAPAGMGWYYKYDPNDPDAPAAIEICGDACVAGQAPDAELELELGCDSIVPG